VISCLPTTCAAAVVTLDQIADGASAGLLCRVPQGEAGIPVPAGDRSQRFSCEPANTDDVLCSDWMCSSSHVCGGSVLSKPAGTVGPFSCPVGTAHRARALCLSQCTLPELSSHRAASCWRVQESVFLLSTSKNVHWQYCMQHDAVGHPQVGPQQRQRRIPSTTNMGSHFVQHGFPLRSASHNGLSQLPEPS
jgi:hypothetical protein